VKPVGFPGGFCVDVEPPPVLVPVDAVAVAAGVVLAGAVERAPEAGVDADVAGAFDAVASLVPVTPALRGDDEL
jgi:hypothetical protein